MIATNIPGFTGEQSLYRSTRRYRGRQSAGTHGTQVVPAIPYCGNCEWILDNCSRNGWRPRGLCNYCARGICYDEPEPGQNP